MGGRRGRRRDRPKLRLTKKGAWFTLAILLVTAPSYAMSHSLLFLLTAFFMAILLYNAIIAWLTMRGVSLSASPLGDWHAATPGLLGVRVWVRARGRQRDFWLTAQSKDCAARATAIGALPKPGTSSHKIVVRGLKRGWLKLDSVCCSTSYPFGLIRATQCDPREHRVLVLPKILPDDVLEFEQDRTRGGVTPVTSGDYQYLDEYRPGEDVRFIHWKKSANRDVPVIRRDVQRQDTPRRRILVPDACPWLEFAISFVASQAIHPNSDTSWSLWTGHELVEATPLDHLLRQLATSQPVNTTPNDHVTQDAECVLASDFDPDPIILQRFLADLERADRDRLGDDAAPQSETPMDRSKDDPLTTTP